MRIIDADAEEITALEAQGYDKLVEALRCCGNEGCHKCPYKKHIHEKFCWVIAMKDAADAIEDLLESVGMLNQQRSYWIDKAAEYYNQLPKRGEWIKRHEFVEDMRFDGFRCSICNWWKGDFETYNYCPKCGAKMEVQDG